jgi:thermitase
MSNDARVESVFGSPSFDVITVEVEPGPHAQRQEETLAALKRAAERVLPGERGRMRWYVESVDASDPFSFDLLPPESLDVSVREAWDLAYALREEALVMDAEPSCEFFQDNAPDALERGAAQEAFGLRPEALALEAVANDSEPDWSPKLIEAPDAWGLTPPRLEGRQRGEGIRIGHPDSGYLAHRELGLGTGLTSRIRADLAWDFIEGDTNAVNDHGGHGLGTASVIMSGDNRATNPNSVTGVAPLAELVPMRVTKKHLLVPSPVLFRSGARRLRQAIHYASRDDLCQVVSVSLGWFKNKSLHRAIKAATRNNLIVCAAAGNYVRIVVWPARYPEVIGVAGCDGAGDRWWGSSRGGTVDVTGPAENVWKAAVEGGAQAVVQSDGTSFAAASTAGIAALWLAHHGRQFLIDRYGGEFSLTTVFRRVLTQACDPPPPGHDGKFGAGIVNAQRTLGAPLPTLEAMRVSVGPILESGFATAPDRRMGGIERVEEAFDGVSPERVRNGVSRLLRCTEPELTERLNGVGDEVAFHLFTTPRLRRVITQLDDASEDLAESRLEPEAASPEELSDSFASLEGLSDRLRGRLK